jgi:DNA-binding response OmpR family regulator
VILDLGLPKLNGWETFQRLKQANPKVKVILASGYLTEQAEIALRRRELSGIVMKPYEMDEVLAKVAAAIR